LIAVAVAHRHGSVLKAVDMPTGERWSYAIFLLHVLFCEHNIRPYMMMYDINCRFKGHLQNWLQRSSNWSDEAIAWAMLMHCPLPPFHKHMHNALCQAKNALQFVRFGGKGTGEPTEQYNLGAGPLGVTSQYATLPTRAVLIEVNIAGWNRRKRAGLAEFLVRAFSRASEARNLAIEQQRRNIGLALELARQQGVYDADFKQVNALLGCTENS
jgi:hypothetical protein